METLNLMHYSCPFCGASDRNRLYCIFLKQQFKEWEFENKKPSILDIAPDKTLSAWIQKYDFITYRSVDLYMQDTDDKADITNLDIYKDNRFDFVLCSHVIEHIQQDRKALSELFRILKPKGFAIIMAPIFLNLEHDIDSTIYDTPALRWKYFGQDDHVRAYSKQGFIDKLTDTGFKVSQLDQTYFGKDIYEKHGIHQRSVLYIATKP
jgi:SAM-dependent methyltransferase